MLPTQKNRPFDSMYIEVCKCLRTQLVLIRRSLAGNDRTFQISILLYMNVETIFASKNTCLIDNTIIGRVCLIFVKGNSRIIKVETNAILGAMEFICLSLLFCSEFRNFITVT